MISVFSFCKMRILVEASIWNRYTDLKHCQTCCTNCLWYITWLKNKNSDTKSLFSFFVAHLVYAWTSGTVLAISKWQSELLKSFSLDSSTNWIQITQESDFCSCTDETKGCFVYSCHKRVRNNRPFYKALWTSNKWHLDQKVAGWGEGDPVDI